MSHLYCTVTFKICYLLCLYVCQFVSLTVTVSPSVCVCVSVTVTDGNDDKWHCYVTLSQLCLSVWCLCQCLCFTVTGDSDDKRHCYMTVSQLCLCVCVCVCVLAWQWQMTMMTSDTVTWQWQHCHLLDIVNIAYCSLLMSMVCPHSSVIYYKGLHTSRASRI